MAPERSKNDAGDSTVEPASSTDGPSAKSPSVEVPSVDELLGRRLPDRLTRTNLSNLRFVEDYVLEAERLVRELKAAVVAMREDGPSGHPVGTLRDAFEAAWETELSVDERAADKAFFDELLIDEPSRSWILAES